MPDHSPASDLTEILDAIDRIRDYLSGMDEQAFFASMIAYDATLMNLIVVGEAARRIDNGVLGEEPAIPWTKVVAMRNRIAHGYEDLDPATIWRTVQDDLPPLRAAVERLLARHQPPP